MFPGDLHRTGRLDLSTWVVLVVMLACGPVVSQEARRLPAQPVTITPTFEPEGLPNQFEEGAALPLAMTTAGGGETQVACFAYSPDGAWLAVGDCPTRPLCTFLGDAPINQNGGLIRIIDLSTRRVARTIRPIKRPRHEYEIVRLAYTPDGRTLVAHGKEVWTKERKAREVGYHLSSWHVSNGREIRRIDAAKLDDWKLPTFSQDASRFAARTHAGVRVWDVATGRELPAPVEASTEPEVLAFAPDSMSLVAGNASGDVGFWDVPSGRRIARIPGHQKEGRAFKVTFLAFSPDGRTLACGGLLSVEVEPFHWTETSDIRLIDLATNRERTTIPGVAQNVFQDVAFSPDGRTIAAVSSSLSGDVASGLVTLYDAATGKERTSANRARTPTHVAYSSDGSLLVTAGQEWIALRDPNDASERVSLHQEESTAVRSTLALSPDGRTLASTNGRFKLWDLRAAKAPPTGGGHRFAVTCLAFSPDAKTLASGSLDRTVKLWDLATGRPRTTLVGHPDDVVQVAYAPDGRTVASADSAGRVLSWDTHTGARRRTLQGPVLTPWLLAFAPDGQSLCLVSWRHDQPIEFRRWEAATGKLLPTPTIPANSPPPLAFSSDGGLLVAADQTRITIWNGLTGKLKSEFSGGEASLSLLVSRDGKRVCQMTQASSLATYRESDGVWKADNLFSSQGYTLSMGSATAGEHMTATPEGARLAALIEGSVRVFDTVTRRSIACYAIDEDATTWLALSPDGNRLALGQTSGDILVFDLKRGN